MLLFDVVWCLVGFSSQYTHRIFLAGDVVAIEATGVMCQYSDPERITLRTLLWLALSLVGCEYS